MEGRLVSSVLNDSFGTHTISILGVAAQRPAQRLISSNRGAGLRSVNLLRTVFDTTHAPGRREPCDTVPCRNSRSDFPRDCAPGERDNEWVCGRADVRERTGDHGDLTFRL